MRKFLSVVAALAFTAVLLSFDSRNVPSIDNHSVSMEASIAVVPLEVSAPDLVPSIEAGYSWQVIDMKLIAREASTATDIKLGARGVLAKPHCVYYPCYTNWLGQSVRIVVCSENGNIDAPQIVPCS